MTFFIIFIIMNIENINNQEYYIENNRVIFTEFYHLKRGYCCGSHGGCRHCPYEPKGQKGNTNLKKKSDNQ